VLVPLVLLALPATFFDNGRPMCLSVILADMECYACGMTRATMHLIHFDFEEAWMYNKLIYVVFPIIAFLWAAEFFKEVKKIKAHRKATQATPKGA